MKTYMFPGQGSQARGMGGTLFEEFGELTAQADSILGYSIRELCLNDPRSELNRTQFTQPALYVVNALSYFKKLATEGKPDYVAGHSLGEFNALLAAECFDFQTGLQLVQKRGELMSRATNGGMAAIVNANREQIVEILQKNGLTEVDLANYNSPNQIVISGPMEDIGRAQAFFQEGRMLFYPLNTSGAFHSRFMRPAQEEFTAFLETFTFQEGRIPVIANFTARPYEAGRLVHTLASQIAGTVQWCDSIQYLMGLQTNGAGPMEFEEIGHGDVLKKLLKAIKRQGASAPAAAPAVAPASAAAQPAATTTMAAARTAAERIPPGEKVTAWNSRHPVGTPVKSLIVEAARLETRSAAVLLFGHRAAVYLKGYNGYFDLDELVPV